MLTRDGIWNEYVKHPASEGMFMGRGRKELSPSLKKTRKKQPTKKKKKKKEKALSDAKRWVLHRDCIREGNMAGNLQKLLRCAVRKNGENISPRP